MNNYQFRINWLGHLVLQRKFMYNRFYGDKYFVWHDASVEDLKDYYEQLYHLQKPCAGQELGSVPAMADLSKITRSTGPK